ncbi:U3-aranetoxin-Ce1a-like [Mytilus trossulus]|uniref:U3-aranetoxin-Ce1a-like n=1 Tax=Mytilus trossulus TaxID=6551 RepID=UPI00300658A3
MWKEIFVLFGISIAIASSSKVQCKHTSECASDECCFYHEGPMVASKKRQASILPFAGMVQGGWCEKYRTQGEHCSGIATMNGHCGCAPGLKCNLIQDPTLPTLTIAPIKTILKRSMLFGWHSECQTAP